MFARQAKRQPSDVSKLTKPPDIVSEAPHSPVESIVYGDPASRTRASRRSALTAVMSTAVWA